MKTIHTLLSSAALALVSTGAAAQVDFTGYGRIGPGQKQADRCFSGGQGGGLGSEAPGHGGIGRLGNECNTYVELAVSKDVQAGNVNYKGLLMTWFASGGSNANDPETRVSQFYVEGKGFDFAPEQTFWIGKIYYHRADVHMDDSFYLEVTQHVPTGVGVDKIKVGSGSLGLALFRKDDADSTTNAGTLFNADLQGLDVNPNGKLRLMASVSRFSGTDGKSGFGLTVQHNQKGLWSGAENTLFAQYAVGSTSLRMGFAEDLTYNGVTRLGGTMNSDYKRWRIGDSLTWWKGPLTGQTLLHYGSSQVPVVPGSSTSVTAKTWSAAGRVAYALTNNFKLQAEAGYASTKPDSGGDSQNIGKITFAPTVSVGPNYFDRPELRFYVSGFNFNDAFKRANGLSDSTKWTAGFQMELWF